MTARALLFPGQGAQTVGMGQALCEEFAAARAVFEEADDVLGMGLSALCWQGPEEELTLTQNAQPAILAHSIAALRVVHEDVAPIAAAAGHSLGEFSAHVAAGTMSFADGLRAVRLRGQLMFEAGLRRPGTMAAVLGLADDEVRAVCASVSRADSVCVAANLNSPGQVVVSGDPDAIQRAEVGLREAGAKRVVALNVSGAFHSPLMEPAQDGLAQALASVPLTAPRFPVVSNVTAAAVQDGQQAAALLVEQLTSPVRWSECVQALSSEFGITEFVELGPGTVLQGLNRRNAKGSTSVSVGDPDGVRALRSMLESDGAA